MGRGWLELSNIEYTRRAPGDSLWKIGTRYGIKFVYLRLSLWENRVWKFKVWSIPEHG